AAGLYRTVITTRNLTRILLVAILVVPLLWLWPRRGVTASFYTNPEWKNEPALVRVERQINLDFMNTDSRTLPQEQFSVEWTGWLRVDPAGQHPLPTRSNDGAPLEGDGHRVGRD